MNLKKDRRKLSAAAIAVALAGCNAGQESGLDSLAAYGTGVTIPPDEIPAHCMPISEDPAPVLLSGPAPTGNLKKGTRPGTGTGTGTVAPVALGAPPLQAGVGPATADVCGPASAKLPGIPAGPPVVRECFFTGTDPTVQATVERVLESVDDTNLVHVRLTFNPNFVDNSYGATAMGWANSKNGTHTYKDLVGSDHAELLFTNKQDVVALHVKLDYISVDASRPSGYGTLGVLGGEGAVLVGKPSYVRKVATSLDRNLNGCGYGSYLESSPATDQAYKPNASAPNWDFRVVYELWIAAEAFGTAGFGGVNIEYVHASPSKIGNNTLIVDPGPCPPDSTPPVVTPPVVTPPVVTPPVVTPPVVTPPVVTPPVVTPPVVTPPPPPVVTPPPPVVTPPSECPPGTVPRPPSDAGTPVLI